MISSSSLHLCVFSNVSTAKAYSSYWKKLLKLKLPDCSLLPCTVRPPRSDVLGSPLFPAPPPPQRSPPSARTKQSAWDPVKGNQMGRASPRHEGLQLGSDGRRVLQSRVRPRKNPQRRALASRWHYSLGRSGLPPSRPIILNSNLDCCSDSSPACLLSAGGLCFTSQQTMRKLQGGPPSDEK